MNVKELWRKWNGGVHRAPSQVNVQQCVYVVPRQVRAAGTGPHVREFGADLSRDGRAARDVPLASNYLLHAARDRSSAHVRDSASVSELQLWEDGVFMRPRRLDAVFMIIRESTRLVRRSPFHTDRRAQWRRPLCVALRGQVRAASCRRGLAPTRFELLSKVMAALAESNAARHIFCPSSNYIEYDNGKQFEDPVTCVPPQKEDWLTRKMNAPFEVRDSVLNFNVAST